MLREGYPLYPLGSVQDTAMQYTMIKDQRIETQKFQGLARVFALGSTAPYVKDSDQLNQDFADILDDVSSYIEFNEGRISKKYKFRKDHQSQLIKTVGKMPIDPFSKD